MQGAANGGDALPAAVFSRNRCMADLPHPPSAAPVGPKGERRREVRGGRRRGERFSQSGGRLGELPLEQIGGQVVRVFRRRLRCSFCRRREDEVARLVGGAVAYICDQCIEKCVGVLKANGGWMPPP
jgi:hypothetical protein